MRSYFLLVLLFLAACSQVTTRKTVDESEISPLAKQKLEESRELIKAEKHKLALAKLTEMPDKDLQPLEKALKYNLKGVILFHMNEVEKSLLNFDVANKYAPAGSHIFSQVQLNMASGHFKLGKMGELKEHLSKVDRTLLTPDEQKKYAQLGLAYALKMGNPSMLVSSSLALMAELKTFDEIRTSPMTEPMKENFKKLSQGQRIELLEEFNGQGNLAVAYLAQVEVEDRYMSGDKDGAKDVVSWLGSEYAQNPEVDKFTKEFEVRMTNSGRLSVGDIGLVLPLSGEKASFGQKALAGIDVGLKALGLSEGVKIHTKDSVDSPIQGAQGVTELIRQDKVAFIIGGLFPESAKAEFLEARKYGVLYISLSPINLPKEEKNHHLIEIQGSVESQIDTLLSGPMIEKFGSRLGVIFPENETGKAYVDEIWRRASSKKVKITSVASYPKNTHDYRDPAQLFLGLSYPRERLEELNILEDVYSLEKTSIRRVQTLNPVLDFDWVFMASYPHEALGLIPTLGYYDANRIKIVGGPSWVAKSLVKEQKNLGTLYFVGDDPKDLNQELLQKFQEIYGKPATLIEILALDAMKVGSEVLADNSAEDRDEFDAKLRSRKLKGLATEFTFEDGVWLKKMKPMTITRGEVVKMFEGEESP